MAKFSIIQKSEPQRIVLGVVSEPTQDLQGDIIPAADIEKMCHDFNLSLQDSALRKSMATIFKAASDELAKGNKEVYIDVTDLLNAVQNEPVEKGNIKLGDNHESWNGDMGDILESYIAPVDFDIEGQQVLKGSWLMAVKLEPDNFQKALDGDLTGFSIGGFGQRTPIAD